MLGTDYIVDTSRSDKKFVLSKEDLEKVIKQNYKGEIQENLLSCIDEFMEIQEKYNVNAIFAISVTIWESSGGTNWNAIDPSTYNWLGIDDGNGGLASYNNFNQAVTEFGKLISGSTYFGSGNYTVNNISKIYCPDTWQEWSKDINSEMTKLYNSIGIYVESGGTEDNSGPVSKFTVGNRTYTNWKQNRIEAYKDIRLAHFENDFPKTNLFNSGCAITSVAIIATGFGNDVDPIDVNTYEADHLYGATHDIALNHYTGLTCTWVYSNIKEGIISQLKQGYPVMIHVAGHFLTILSISDDGNSIYVSDPWCSNSTRNGWLPISVIGDRYYRPNGNYEKELQAYLKMEG